VTPEKLPRDLSGRDFRKALERVGFVFKRQRGSHMILHREQPSATLVVPDHPALKVGLVRKLLDQAGLTSQQFLDLLR
jgi:predicted RNA binding protein YcfA (HicA-like mRNA interferase family)